MFAFVFLAALLTAVPVDTTPPSTACDHPVSIITAVQPWYPDSAREMNLPALTALVKVHVGSDGRVLDVQLSQSTGVEALDKSSMKAARASTYAPKAAACSPVDGYYMFRASFLPS